MQVLIEIALKSLLIAGLTLALLAAMKRRSAAERSWVAHIGLLALVIVAFAPLVLPSWKLEAPALLGQTPAVEATVQTPAPASTIVAHELAHVARMDWAKLLLARIATALFWFNPLVWLLAREAHQLREEAADDSVLAADIADTDYAQLLVGVARHECPGLLLGAHGVAPSKSSLARRVARVLDGASVRGPAARPFALGVLAGALLMAAPLAALTLTPGGPSLAKPLPAAAGKAQPLHAAYAVPPETPTDLPHIIARG